jgi:hypothetical protein
VKTKWDKCDLNTYQSTITDGVAQVLQNSIRNIEEDIIAMEEFIHLRVFLLPSVVILEGPLFPLVFLHFSTGYI